jgi:hypothetical protein
MNKRSFQIGSLGDSATGRRGLLPLILFLISNYVVISNAVPKFFGIHISPCLVCSRKDFFLGEDIHWGPYVAIQGFVNSL